MASGRSVSLAVRVFLILCLHSCYADDFSSTPQVVTVTHEVTFKMYIGGVYIGNLGFGIFYNVAPITSLNFLTICAGNTTDPNGVRLTYENALFHRIIANFMVQGGDIVSRNGWGVTSIYGGTYFADEPFTIKHYGAGQLGMANAGPNTNGCQFYITTVTTKWLDDQHVIFGKVIFGMDVLRQIEHTPTDSHDRPLSDVVIAECLVKDVAQPYTVTTAPVDG